MKEFTVALLFMLIVLIFVSASISNVDLTPDNGTVVEGAQVQAAPIIPLAPTPGVSSVTPLEVAPQTQSTGLGVLVQVPAVGVPVPGGTTCPTPAIPVTGGACPTAAIPVTVTCGVQYIPVTGGCGVTYVPVTGIPVTGIPVTGYCSNPYVVYYGDTISRIARACGTTIPAILALNPGITNANVIYPGQVLWL